MHQLSTHASLSFCQAGWVLLFTKAWFQLPTHQTWLVWCLEYCNMLHNLHSMIYFNLVLNFKCMIIFQSRYYSPTQLCKNSSTKCHSWKKTSTSSKCCKSFTFSITSFFNFFGRLHTHRHFHHKQNTYTSSFKSITTWTIILCHTIMLSS